MFREKNSLHDTRDLKHHLAGVSVSPDTFAALFPQADSPASAQDLLSRIKQEDPPCVWAQQELAERDIPTDPNSGERAVGARGDDFCNRQKTIRLSHFGQRPVKDSGDKLLCVPQVVTLYTFRHITIRKVGRISLKESSH